MPVSNICPGRREVQLRSKLETAARTSGQLLLVAAFLVLVGWVAVRLALVVVAVFLAGLGTSILFPAVRFLSHRGLPRWLAALIVLLFAATLLVLSVVWIVPGAIREVRENGEELVQRIDALARAVTATLPGDTAGLEELLGRVQGFLADNARRVTAGVAAGVAQTIEVLTGLALALVLTFFFLRDGEGIFIRAMAELAPERRRIVRPMLERSWGTLAGWFRGAAIVAFVDAVGIGIGLVVVGVPLALPLALLTFIGGFVPVVGATVAGAIAVVVAWASGGTQDALIILAVVLAVQQLEGNVLEPFVLGRFIPLHPAAILVVLTAGGILGGIAGAFLAVPLTSAAVAGISELRSRLALAEAARGKPSGLS